jgi:hypothetical protein
VRTTPGVLNVLSVYDDFIGAIQACEAAEWLQHHFGARLRVKHRAWSFATLTGPDLQASAALEWTDSDLLIVSGHGPRPLPENVRQWLGDCFQQNAGGPAALVALYDFDSAPEAIDGPLVQDLRQIAWRWRMEFISNEDFEMRMHADFCTRPAAPATADSHSFSFLLRSRPPAAPAQLAGQA